MATKLTKTQQALISELEIGTESETVTNPYSGKSVLLTPIGVALYDFIKGCEMLHNYKNFDNARYAFQKLFPSEYMTLLD